MNIGRIQYGRQKMEAGAGRCWYVVGRVAAGKGETRILKSRKPGGEAGLSGCGGIG